MATDSLYPSVDIPEVDLWDFIFERERDFPDERGLYFLSSPGNSELTGVVIFTQPGVSRQYRFIDVKNTAAAFGHALRTLWNWQKGDVVAWYSPNSVDTPALNFGVLWAGGVASPANPAYSVTELAFQLKNCGAKALVTQAFCLDKAIEAAKSVGLPLNRIILIGADSHPDALHFLDFLAEARYEDDVDRVTSAPGDVSYIPYSSVSFCANVFLVSLFCRSLPVLHISSEMM